MHTAPETGTPAPDFSVADVEGEIVSLTHYRGESRYCWCSIGVLNDPSAVGT